MSGMISIKAQQISIIDQSVNAVALSQSGVSQSGPFSMYSNMGAVSFLDRSGLNLNAGFFYGLPELKILQAGTALRISEVDFGILTLGSFGDIDYRETSIGIGYSRLLSNKVGIGLKGNYTQLSISEFGTGSSWTVEGGILMEFHPKMAFGYHGKYFFSFDTYSSNSSHYHSIGISYSPVNSTQIMVSTIYQDNWSIHVGVIYDILEKLWVKVGVDGMDPSFSMGVGYQISSSLDIESAFQFHSQLGTSPFIGLVYYFQSKTKQEP